MRSLPPRAANKTCRLTVAFFRILLPRSLTTFYADLRRPSLPEEDHTKVTLFSTAEVRVPGWEWRLLPPLHRPSAVREPVSLVALLRDRVDQAVWIEEVAKQTRLPDEVIIVDTTPTGDRAASVRDLGGTMPNPAKVVAGQDLTAGQAWNVGIDEASHPVVACIDAGCELDPRWLERLTAPFEVDEGITVAAGSCEPTTRSLLARALASAPANVQRATRPSYAPSRKPLAFRKGAWASAGGYPEWCTHPAEETYFELALRRVSPRWALVPEARARSRTKSTALGILSAAHRQSFAEGEAGLRADEHWRVLTGGSLRMLLFAVACAGLGLAFLFPWLLALPAAAAVLAAVALARDAAGRRQLADEGPLATVGSTALAGIVAPAVGAARLLGFVRGVSHRHRAFERRSGEIAGITFLLSLMPISDSGGGQRPAQLARELLRRGHMVVFLNKWESNEIAGLRTTVRDPLLVTYAAAVFDPATFLRRHETLVRSTSLTTIVEAPVPTFADLATRLRDAGSTVVYEVIDDWDTSLGSGFYSRAGEDAIIDVSDVLTATARPLMKYLERSGSKPVTLLPNAVNTEIFDRRQSYPRPPDMPTGEFTACYAGALWGSWFDWDLLRRVALSYPDASVVVIGDYRGQCPDRPPNLHFLGLRPQCDLPAYLAHSDVCIIPWSLNKITEATSPLKLYEYLAMGKPVVTSWIKEVEGLPYVLLSRTDQEFVANVEKARRLTVEDSVIDAFVSENSWAHRVSALLDLTAASRAAGGAGQPSPRGGRAAR